jgi:uncharacterized damage-inducible protein DinB
MQDLRYPVGPFKREEMMTPERRREMIEVIAACPARLREAVAGLNDEQLDTPYRPGGWTVRQVVHHVPDSHLNAYVRTKLALTEEKPTIKPYAEALWAELPDSSKTPIDVSLQLLESMTERWVTLLRSLTTDQFGRSFIHPEHGREMTLDLVLGIYEWHSRHHVAHVTELRKRQGW